MKIFTLDSASNEDYFDPSSRRTAPVGSAASSDPQNNPVHSMMVVYENPATKARARRMCDNLIREIDEHSLWAKKWWNLTTLPKPESRRQGLEALALADVVVLALDGNTKLSEDFKVWMEEWGCHLFDRGPVLIALFDQPDNPSNFESTRSFLGTFAETSELTFLYSLGEALIEYKPSVPLKVGQLDILPV